MEQTMENVNDAERPFGIFGWKPKWMQSFANRSVFLVIFCLTRVLQGMYKTYFMSILANIEKMYQIPSKVMILIMSMEVIHTIAALIFSYYGRQGHRPKWIAYSMIMFSIASIFCATPHFFFGKLSETSMPAENATIFNEFKSKLCNKSTFTTPLSTSVDDTAFSVRITEFELRLKYNSSLMAAYPDWFSGRFVTYKLPLPPKEQPCVQKNLCEDNLTNSMHNNIGNNVVLIFFLSLIFLGIGSTAVYTIGIPYIDDNITSRDSPLYFAFTIGVQILDPIFGFLLGSFCTNVYVDWPFKSTNLRPDNPEWLGAWWLGFLIMGLNLMILSFPMMTFPKELQLFHETNISLMPIEFQIYQQGPQSGNAERNGDVAKPSIKGFLSNINRLLENKIFLLRTISSVLHSLAISGYYTLLPKYLEVQFQLTVKKSLLITGLVGTLMMGVGIFGSSTYLRKYKPKARSVAKWIAICTLLYSFGMIILIRFSCTSRFVGLNVESEYELKTEKNCSTDCLCRPGVFAPICTSKGVTYLSPCLAGCSQMMSTSDHKYNYSDCECLGPNLTATDGLCTNEYSESYQYIVIFAIFWMLHSTSEVGSMLLTLRCVDSEYKTMALGLISFATGLFGNVPYTFVYEAVADSLCLFYEDNSSVEGACRVYDSVKLSKVFHGMTALIMFLAFLVDSIVWYKIEGGEPRVNEGSCDKARGDGGSDNEVGFSLEQETNV